MKNKILDILNKGKAKNSSVAEQHEMFSLFYQTDKEDIIKDKLFEDLDLETLDSDDEFPQLEVVFSKIWHQINRRNNKKIEITNAI